MGIISRLRQFASMVLISVALSNSPWAADSIRLVTMSYPPYEFEQNDVTKGVAVDIVVEAFRRTRRDVQISILPWARALEEVKSGSASGIFTIYKTPERELFLNYMEEPLISQAVALFAMRKSSVRYDGTIFSLAGTSIGVVNRASYGSVFDNAVNAGWLNNVDRSASDFETNARKFLKGRFDVLVNDRWNALYLFKKLQALDQVKELVPELQSVDCFLAFNKVRDFTQMRMEVDSALAGMKKDGTYQRIIDQYKQYLQ